MSGGMVRRAAAWLLRFLGWGALWLGCSLALLLVYVFTLRASTTKRLAGQQRRLEDAVQEIRMLEATTAKLDLFHAAVARVEARLETLNRIIPAEVELDSLKSEVEARARLSGVALTEISAAGPAKPHEFYAAVPVHAALVGPLEGLGRFVDSLARGGPTERLVTPGREAGRLVTLETLELEKSSSGRYNARLDATIYRLLGAEGPSLPRSEASPEARR
jgi:Tfp pilus assembly protein PilO